MSFFGSLFGGQNQTLNAAIPQYGSISSFGVGQGENDINAASGFWSNILSGDPTKIGQVLGPQIQAIQGQGQQQKQTLGQFGNRSGGTNATAQTIGDTTRSNVNNLVGNLTGAAANNLGSMGTNLLGQGTAALGSQVNASQQQMKNWSSSILGGLTGGLSSVLSGVATGGISTLFGGGGGGGIGSGDAAGILDL